MIMMRIYIEKENYYGSVRVFGHDYAFVNLNSAENQHLADFTHELNVTHDVKHEMYWIL